MKNEILVEVKEVNRRGILVSLDDGRNGYIPFRELTWDRRIGFIPPTPQPGEVEVAIIKEEDPETGFLYLSLRDVTDPWDAAIKTQKYNVGQSLVREIVQIRHFGAYVQLEPGIDAIIRPEEVPLGDNQLIDNVLWPGDKVFGIITKADLANHQVEFSLKKVLVGLAQNPNRAYDEMELLEIESSLIQPPNKVSVPIYNNNKSRRFHPPIPKPKRILVIDNDELCNIKICDKLRIEFDFEVDRVENGNQAFLKAKQGIPYGLVVINITLNDEHGAVVAERIREIKPSLPILYIIPVVDFFKNSNLVVDPYETPVCIKKIDQIIETIDDMLNGFWSDLPGVDEQESKDDDRFIHQLGLSSFARRALPDLLHEILYSLRKEIQVNQAVILKFDPSSQKFSLVAAEPTLNDRIQERTLDSLFYSPVRRVLEDELEFRRNNLIFPDMDEGQDVMKARITAKNQEPRPKNLFRLINYRSCFGIPIVIPDHITRYVLFIFDMHPWKFSTKVNGQKKSIWLTRQAAQSAAVAIERDTLLNNMRHFQKCYYQGQLFLDLVHEINNKFNTLKTSIVFLRDIYPLITNKAPNEMKEDYISSTREATDRVLRVENDISDLIASYQKMATHDLEPVNLNHVIDRVVNHLKDTAKDANVRFILDLNQDIPLITAIPMHLEQILTNLILNAIQQIKLSLTNFQAPFSDQLIPGCVKVQTGFLVGAGQPSVFIKIIDTGPGIHYQIQEKIFSMGYTTREDGAGLGLFISRDLIERLGGQLRLYSSIRFIGSEFIIEFPKNRISIMKQKDIEQKIEEDRDGIN